jgi:hypothetical protein
MGSDPRLYNRSVVARKRLVKTEDFYVSCDHSDNWSVWYRETVIITV